MLFKCFSAPPTCPPIPEPIRDWTVAFAVSLSLAIFFFLVCLLLLYKLFKKERPIVVAVPEGAPPIDNGATKLIRGEITMDTKVCAVC